MLAMNEQFAPFAESNVSGLDAPSPELFEEGGEPFAAWARVHGYIRGPFVTRRHRVHGHSRRT